MHYLDNPFTPKVDSEKNTIIVDNVADEYHNITSVTKTCVNRLPPDFSFHQLSFVDDGKAILDFINSNYYDIDHIDTKTYFDYSIIQFFIDMGECDVYCVKYKNTIIALQTIEYVNVFFNDENIPGCYADFLIINPKFRKSFLNNVFVALVYGKIAEKGVKIEFWCSHHVLKFKPYVVKSLYLLPLSDVPNTIHLCRSKAKRINTTDAIDVRPPTTDEMKLLNQRRYKMQFEYSDNRISATLKHNICLTDGESLVLFSMFYNSFELMKAKTVVMTDRIKGKNFIPFFKGVIKKLTSDYAVDMITILNTDYDDMISAFNFEKNSNLNYYMMNMYPKVKRDEVMLCFR